MNTKRFLILAIIIILSSNITMGCSFRSFVLSRDDEKVADKRFNDIMKALENKDNEGLKNMFSPKALEEANDIDDGINYIMDFYKGDIISKEVACESSDSNNHGEKTSELKSFYTVTTDEDTYIIFFIDQLVDTKEPDNEGLYMLQIIKESDRDKEFDWGNDTKCAGIYLPAETEENK